MKHGRQLLAGAAALAGVMAGGVAAAQEAPLRPDQVAFRSLYKELVETDTSITTGSCTLLADKVEKHLRAAGYGDADITRFAVPDHPKEGGLVVILPGTSKTLKPILLLGHLDVVVAKREDWTRDPMNSDRGRRLFLWSRHIRHEGDGRHLDRHDGADEKEGVKNKRTLKLALTCGEETSWAFNGAQWLANNKRDLIDAEFALNEGGGGRTDGKGKVIVQNLHVGEKTVVNYRIEATNPGGHSSIPIPDNAI
jgi:acetylornithine deacetylase/succinyl-diaminopimelate desuccinylase-like protein